MICYFGCQGGGRLAEITPPHGGLVELGHGFFLLSKDLQSQQRIPDVTSRFIEDAQSPNSASFSLWKPSKVSCRVNKGF